MTSKKVALPPRITFLSADREHTLINGVKCNNVDAETLRDEVSRHLPDGHYIPGVEAGEQGGSTAMIEPPVSFGVAQAIGNALANLEGVTRASVDYFEFDGGTIVDRAFATMPLQKS